MSRSMLFCLQISCDMNYQSRNLIYQYINLTPRSVSYYGLIFTKKDNLLCWFRVSHRCWEHERNCAPHWRGALQNLMGELSQYIGDMGGDMGGGVSQMGGCFSDGGASFLSFKWGAPQRGVQKKFRMGWGQPPAPPPLPPLWETLWLKHHEYSRF